MASFFRPNDDGQWVALLLPPLPEVPAAGGEGSASSSMDCVADELAALGICVAGFHHEGGAGMVLLAEPRTDVLVNGLPVPGHLHVLGHRDEIRIAGLRLFFSAESPPRVEPYQTAQGARRVRCPVCRGPIEEGQSVVRCPGPGCSRLYHQIEARDDQPARPCWTYDAQCKFCHHPTSLDGRLTWTPDKEDL